MEQGFGQHSWKMERLQMYLLLQVIIHQDANDIAAGTVVLTWTVTGTAPIALACNSATSSMTLTIIPAPTAFAGGNANICENNPYPLSAATATNQFQLWTTYR